MSLRTRLENARPIARLKHRVRASVIEPDENSLIEDPFLKFARPGHFYSPIPSSKDIVRRGKTIFSKPAKTLPGIELNETGQLETLEQIRALYEEHPFPKDHKPDCRFFLNNNEYSWGDAITLYAFLRIHQPKRLIEIGSGYSSAIILDTNERFLNEALDCTFIEPYPDRFHLLCGKDQKEYCLKKSIVQDIPLETFSELEAGDILIVDSSHVAKIGSDVNHILFSILPILKPGVIIHVHDIFYPFEYPKRWLQKGIAWNEAYILRAFLTNNLQYNVLFFNDYIKTFHAEKFSGMPIFEYYAGQSLWLEKGHK